MRKYWLTAAIPVAAVAVTLALSIPGAGATTTTLSAKTTMTNRDDSAANTAGNTNNGNWAKDNFTRGSSIVFKGAASASNCGGNSPCYSYTGKVSDVGTFTVDTGQPSPGFGDLNGGADPTMAVSLKGALKGSQTYTFFTTVPISGASASNVPTSNAGDTYNSGEWPELYFPAGTEFWDSSGTDQGTLNPSGGGYLGTGFFTYTYTAAPGHDADCTNVSSQWVDASSDNSGSDPAGGNILAPDATHC